MRAAALTVTVVALGTAVVTAQGDARFKARSELVILDVAVTDGRGAFVRGLPAESFRVLEEGRPQTISFFAEQDAPATIGLLLDSSGSMLVNRSMMIAGLTSLARSSNPDDEFLPLVFNERVTYVLPPGTTFTSDPEELRDALAGSLAVVGKTAFHDALAEALDGIAKGSHERRVLIVLSDGGDNASQLSFDELLHTVLASNVVVYTIALIDPLSRGHNTGALRRLARETGGLAFEPRSRGALTDAFRDIAADIRSRYTLAFEPSDTSSGRFKHVRVMVSAPDRRKIHVRTRTGYMAGLSEPASSAGAGAER